MIPRGSSVQRIAVEEWLLNQIANLLYHLYLLPSIIPPGFAIRRCCSFQEATFTKQLQHKSVEWLLKIGWLVKDVTGILYLSDEICNQFDELAKEISHENFVICHLSLALGD
jgi:hypothetical protein